MLEPGSSLPNVDVVDDTGASVALRDFLGKRLVVWFYPKADTPG